MPCVWMPVLAYRARAKKWNINVNDVGLNEVKGLVWFSKLWTGSLRKNVLMKEHYSPHVLFVTTVSEKEQVKLVQMLIDSIRTFGGSLQDSEIWIFDSSPHVDLCGSMANSNLKTFPLKPDSFLERFPFAGKVTACARAEEKIEDQHLTLVWISQDCLVVNPPWKHILFPPHKAAFRPVHIQNVGSAWDEPMDEYWKEIYQSVEIGRASCRERVYCEV